MADVRHQRWLLAPLLALVAVGAGSPAGASHDRVGGRSTERGVEIEVERVSPPQRTGGGEGATNGGGATTRGSSCLLVPWLFDPGTAKGGTPPTPLHRRFLVSCDGQAIGTRWIGPADPLAAAAARAVEIAGIAQRVLREIPVGDITIGRRPQGPAVTGVPTLLWVEGYDGRPITRTVSELGVTVDVRITLQQTTWDAGDGTPHLVAGLGQPWPRRSDVRHTYETATPRAEPRAVTATLSFFAEYRADGGAWQALAPITRQAATTIDVDEVQAVRNR